MSRQHIVREGDCISSIAFKYGFFPRSIWEESANAELKGKRKDPNALFPGDVVIIPDKRTRKESCATDTLHRFRKKGVPSKLHVVVKREDTPLANVRYVGDIDGQVVSGKTNSQGEIKISISPGAKIAKLTVGEADDAEQFELRLGYLDPVTEVCGIQHRLNNLGFHCGDPDGAMSPRTVDAIKAFQETVGLQSTGEIDQGTQDALKRAHGS